MEDKTKIRIHDFLCGILLAFIFLSLLFSISAIVFSELYDPNLALAFAFGLSFASASTYWLLEFCVFGKNRSSAFSVGYFGSIVLCAAFTFFVSSVFPLSFVFDFSSEITSIYLRTACVRFCVFNAVALVLRLGIETYRYMKNVFSFDDEQ